MRKKSNQSTTKQTVRGERNLHMRFWLDDKTGKRDQQTEKHWKEVWNMKEHTGIVNDRLPN
jgi:hypothetical protein